MPRVLMLLALAAAVVVSGAAEAHVGVVEHTAFEAPELPASAAAAPAQFLAGDPTGFPWPILLMALLAAAALAHRRSRRLVAVGLIVLVAILGVETAVHSVHHALGPQPVACPTASVAAHLHGTAVVALALEQPIHRVGTAAATSDPLLASLRSLDASHPRAPPTALA